MPTGIYKRTKPAWNKGIKQWKNKQHPMKGRHHSLKTKEKMSINYKYHTNSGCFKKGNIPYYKLHPELAPIGENHPNWKGGEKMQSGYILIYQPQHPFCTKKKYIRKSHLIIEQQIGRYLKPEEVVHHINGIRNDNKIENLMAFISNAIHKKFEANPNKIKSKEIIFDGRKLLV